MTVRPEYSVVASFLLVFGIGACASARGDATDDSSAAVTAGGAPLPPPIVLASNLRAPYAIAIDASHVYWTNNGDGTVMKVPLAGGAPMVIASRQGHPSGIAVDAKNVYWVQGDAGGSLMKSPLTGDPTPVAIARAAFMPRTLVLDGAFAYVADDHRLSRLALDGTGLTVIWEDPSEDDIASGLPVGIAVDAKSVYFTVMGLGVFKQPKTGVVDQLHPTTIALGEVEPFGIALDGQNLYWADRTSPALRGLVRRVPIPADGAFADEPAAIVSNQADPEAVVLDDEDVYWTNRLDGTVMKVAKAGGTPVLIASGQGAPQALAVDASSVYWANNESGTIMKRAK